MWNLLGSDMTYVERMRDMRSWADEPATAMKKLFPAEDELNRIDETFRPSVRTLDGRRLTVDGVCLTSMSANAQAGSWVGGGFLSHEAMGYPGVIDHYAHNMGTALTRPEELLVSPGSQCLFGTTTPRVAPLSEFRRDCIDVVLLPQAKGALMVEFIGGECRTLARLALASAGGQPESVCLLSGCSGVSRVDAHGSGEWAIVNTHPASLVNVVDGTVYRIPKDVGHSFTWRPGGSDLLGSTIRDGSPRLVNVGLADGRIDDLGPLIADVDELPGFRWQPTDLGVAPDGRAICLSGLGPAPEYQERHGSRGRVCELQLDSRRIVPLVEPFVNGDGRIERIHSGPRFCEAVEAPPFELSSIFAPWQIEPLSTPSDNAALVDDANDLVVKALRSIFDEDTQPSDLRAVELFIPRAAETIRKEDPDQWASIREWIELCATTLEQMEVLTGDPAFGRLARSVVETG